MSDPPRDAPSVLDLLEEWYHVPALVAVAAFMLWVRLQSYGEFVSDGDVVLSGNDAWYHLRQVTYTVRNWPATMPFDPWTYFPYGTSAGQFGTLYDQLVATAALVVGLGSPSESLVATTLAVAPPVFGALAIVPVYLIGRRIAGRGAALFGAVVLALLPGSFLQRTIVGFADHNGAEPLFMGMAVVGLLAAFSVADEERPVWELVTARDLDELRRPAVWAGLAGFAVAMYMWVWPPGVLLVGILGAYVLVKLTSDHVHGRSPDHGAFAATVAMLVTALLMLVPMGSTSFSPTDFGLLQIVVPLSVAGAAVALAALARLWNARELDATTYPAAVGGTVLVGIAVVAVALPDLYASLTDNFFRFVGFSSGAETRTISEAQPYLAPSSLRQLGFATQAGGVDRVGRLLADYGFTIFTGVAAAIWLVAKPLVRTGETRETGYVAGGLVLIALIYLVPGPVAAVGDAVGVVPEIVGLALVAALVVGATLLVRYDADDLFVLVWAAFVTAAAFTQVRFNYYLALVVAVLNAYLLGSVLATLDLGSIRDAVEGIEGYQVLVVAAVVMLVVTPGLVVPMQVRHTGNAQFDRSATAWQAASDQGPGGYAEWEGSLEWLAENTPAEGDYGGAGNADRMPYYGRYERTDDFEYPAGAYGVQSWWDYGHWITTTGERIPNANPFQQGATEAANYLLAPTPGDARAVHAEQSTEGDQTRYVMVDWQMATPGSKFAAPVVFYDEENVTSEDFYRRVYAANGRTSFLLRDQRFYDSQMTRLYLYHGSRQDARPVVIDWQETTFRTQGGDEITLPAAPGGNRSLVRQFQNMEAAREYVANDSTAQIGGVGGFPSEDVPALEHYRLVDASESSANDSTGYRRIRAGTVRTTQIAPQFVTPAVPAYVKTFERVPGATIRGSNAVPNGTVTVETTLRVPERNETFTYSQQTTADADGEFSLTVPYATTGYDEYGPEAGYTDVSVRATGPYNVSGGSTLSGGNVTTASGTVHVPEGDVNGAEDGTVSVTLERSTEPLFGDDGAVQVNQNDSDSGGGSDANASADLAAPSPASVSGTLASAPTGTGTTASVAPLVGLADLVAPAAPVRRAG